MRQPAARARVSPSATRLANLLTAGAGVRARAEPSLFEALASSTSSASSATRNASCSSAIAARLGSHADRSFGIGKETQLGITGLLAQVHRNVPKTKPQRGARHLRKSRLSGMFRQTHFEKECRSNPKQKLVTAHGTAQLPPKRRDRPLGRSLEDYSAGTGDSSLTARVARISAARSGTGDVTGSCSTVAL